MASMETVGPNLGCPLPLRDLEACPEEERGRTPFLDHDSDRQWGQEPWAGRGP